MHLSTEVKINDVITNLLNKESLEIDCSKNKIGSGKNVLLDTLVRFYPLL